MARYFDRTVLLLWLIALALYPLARAQASCTATISIAPIPWTIDAASTAWGAPTPTTAKFLRVNTKWPADPIIVTKCTQVVIDVKNNLIGENVTLHFHGILQTGGQVIMDGPQGITQRCGPNVYSANLVDQQISGIGPGESFQYSFLADIEGTYWIHSHAPGQYPKGLRAPLIVRNTGDPGTYGYTEPSDGKEEIVTLSDW
jgi:iron transport multicopper oxidase